MTKTLLTCLGVVAVTALSGCSTVKNLWDNPEKVVPSFLQINSTPIVGTTFTISFRARGNSSCVSSLSSLIRKVVWITGPQALCQTKKRPTC